MDAATSVSALHDATTSLVESVLPVARSIDAHDVAATAYRGDHGRALVIGQVRACVASFYEVSAHVLTLEHLLDERHLPALASHRPITTANSLTVVSPRDAWLRAVESLGYGSSYGAAALMVLRAGADPLADDVEGAVTVAEEVAAGLAAVEPYLSVGVDPATVPIRLPAAAAPARRDRRGPRWGPGG